MLKETSTQKVKPCLHVHGLAYLIHVCMGSTHNWYIVHPGLHLSPSKGHACQLHACCDGKISQQGVKKGSVYGYTYSACIDDAVGGAIPVILIANKVYYYIAGIYYETFNFVISNALAKIKASQSWGCYF